MGRGGTRAPRVRPWGSGSPGRAPRARGAAAQGCRVARPAPMGRAGAAATAAAPTNPAGHPGKSNPGGSKAPSYVANGGPGRASRARGVRLPDHSAAHPAHQRQPFRGGEVTNPARGTAARGSRAAHPAPMGRGRGRCGGVSAQIPTRGLRSTERNCERGRPGCASRAPGLRAPDDRAAFPAHPGPSSHAVGSRIPCRWAQPGRKRVQHPPPPRRGFQANPVPGVSKYRATLRTLRALEGAARARCNGVAGGGAQRWCRVKYSGGLALVGGMPGQRSGLPCSTAGSRIHCRWAGPGQLRRGIRANTAAGVPKYRAQLRTGRAGMRIARTWASSAGRPGRIPRATGAVVQRSRIAHPLPMARAGARGGCSTP